MHILSRKKLSILLAILASICLFTPSLHAQVPTLISYQGRVAVGTPPVNFNGTGQFKFAIHNQFNVQIWSNTGLFQSGEPTTSVSLPVTNGLYSVLLGDTSVPNMAALPGTFLRNETNIRLTVWFNDGVRGFQLLQPDQRIAPACYLAPDSVGLNQLSDGVVSSAKIASGAVGTSQLAAGAITTVNIANGAVGTSQLAAGAVTSAKLAAGDFNIAGEVTCTALNITSDRAAKEEFAPVDVRAVLDKVARLPIREWQYKSQPGARHVGPMAQDFREAFALGHDEKHISTVDADGVALAAIQGLTEILREKEKELSQLKGENRALSERMAAIERALGTVSAGGPVSQSSAHSH